jgi:hypothetical protein
MMMVWFRALHLRVTACHKLGLDFDKCHEYSKRTKRMHLELAWGLGPRHLGTLWWHMTIPITVSKTQDWWGFLGLAGINSGIE